MSGIDLSFVFPCLNEEKTISNVILELKKILETMPICTEIIISDNGSTDNSVDLALKLGVQVVRTPIKGYGEALKKGFQKARGKYIAFADIDGSYPLEYLPYMYNQAVTSDADMVVASRLKGRIEKGAMPFLHRYLGTPILTKIINFLFKGKFSDCNSGFRLFKKTSYKSWKVNSSGMEFASELLIKALKHKAKITEISAGLNCDKRSNPPHLKTWRDGMRHLLFILSEAPYFFEKVGLLIISFSTFFEVLSIITGPISLKGITIFDYHSKLIFLICLVLGIQCYLLSLSIYVLSPTEKPLLISSKLLKLSEETLFCFCCISVILICATLFCFFVFWGANSFQGIMLIKSLIDIAYGLLLICMTSFGLIQIHLLKRIKR